jgi:hypothetical protein
MFSDMLLFQGAFFLSLLGARMTASTCLVLVDAPLQGGFRQFLVQGQSM